MSEVLHADLLDLLGDVRAQVMQLLRGTPRTVAELADDMDLSEGAVRRHLQALERDDLITAQTVRREGPGRPSSAYVLTSRGQRLFGDRSGDLANELLSYLSDEYGAEAMRGFMRWRQARQAERYRSIMDADASTVERADQLADALSMDGFPSRVVDTPEDATTLELHQEHCAIAEVAAEHPELCAYEAAMFRDLLGARVSRRQTIAGGAPACICKITDLPEEDPDDTGASHGHAS